MVSIGGKGGYLWVLLLLCTHCEASCIFHYRVRYRALSLRMHALCGYSMFGHHPHLLANLVPNFFNVVPPPIAELAHGAKSDAQSLKHSLSHSQSLFDMPGTEAFASEKGNERKPTIIIVWTAVVWRIVIWTIRLIGV